MKSKIPASDLPFVDRSDCSDAVVFNDDKFDIDLITDKELAASVALPSSTSAIATREDVANASDELLMHAHDKQCIKC